jgi:hypothetical protein
VTTVAIFVESTSESDEEKAVKESEKKQQSKLWKLARQVAAKACR